MLSFLKSTCTCRVADLRADLARAALCCGVLEDCGYGILFPGLAGWQRGSTGKNGVSTRTDRPRYGISVKDRHLANGIWIYGVHELVPVTIIWPTIDDDG